MSRTPCFAGLLMSRPVKPERVRRQWDIQERAMNERDVAEGAGEPRVERECEAIEEPEA